MPGQYMDRDIIKTSNGTIERLKEEINALQQTAQEHRATIHNMHINNRALRVDLLQNHIAVLVATVEAQQHTIANLAKEYNQIENEFEVLRGAIVEIAYEHREQRSIHDAQRSDPQPHREENHDF